MTVEHSVAEREAARVEAQVDELLRILAAVPEERWTHRAAENDWSAAEICGHVVEMLPFWAEQAQRLAGSPGLTFGRSEDDERRIEGVVRGAKLDHHQAVEQVRTAATTTCRIIRALPDAAWAVQGTSITRGPMTVEQIIDALLAGHLEAHVEQVRRAVG